MLPSILEQITAAKLGHQMLVWLGTFLLFFIVSLLGKKTKQLGQKCRFLQEAEVSCEPPHSVGPLGSVWHRKKPWHTESNHLVQNPTMGHRIQSSGTESNHGTQNPITWYRIQPWDTESNHGTQSPTMGHRIQSSGTEPNHGSQNPTTWHRTQNPTIWHRIQPWGTHSNHLAQNPTITQRIQPWDTESNHGTQNPTMGHRIQPWGTESNRLADRIQSSGTGSNYTPQPCGWLFFQPCAEYLPQAQCPIMEYRSGLRTYLHADFFRFGFGQRKFEERLLHFPWYQLQAKHSAFFNTEQQLKAFTDCFTSLRVSHCCFPRFQLSRPEPFELPFVRITLRQIAQKTFHWFASRQIPGWNTGSEAVIKNVISTANLTGIFKCDEKLKCCENIALCSPVSAVRTKAKPKQAKW